MTQDELEDELFLAMLRQTRNGAGPLFDLQELCNVEKIDATTEQLLQFNRDSLNVDGSTKASTLSAIQFEITANGLRRAKFIEETRQPPTLIDRLADDKFQKIGNLRISLLSFIVSIGALVVAALAYLKD